MWTLELGLSKQVIEVAPVARPGNHVGMWTLKISGRGAIIFIILLLFII
jgi:hypothetical protein